MEKMETVSSRIKDSIKSKFRFATLNFIFIIVYVNVFQRALGAENSIVGVIFTIMMSASMARDLTARPVKHLLIQASVLVLMAASACFVSNVHPLLALPVNLLMIFIILYAYTYEYVSHLYFPYILSYLFLVFISPVSPAQLSKRLLGMCVGAISIILYQLFMGRKRVVETARDVLSSMIDAADTCIECLLTGRGVPQEPGALRANLCKLSRIVYERRKRALCISDASFAMIDAGRGLENLVLLLYEMEGPVTPARAELLRRISAQLTLFREFVQRETDHVQLPDWAAPGLAGQEDARFDQCLLYIGSHLQQMALPQKRGRYRKTALSLSLRLKAMLDVSPVRVVYALRVSILLALCTFMVQLLHLPHGKWLLFTVSSVSLPYADDIGTKARKRLVATLTGGLAGIVLYALIPSATGRTAVMMLSGYLSFYFSDYSATFACSTVGALGGAVFAGTFGWEDVGGMLGVRLGYICIGIVLALLANCLILPFRRKEATRQLWEKYASTTALLTRICQEDQVDPQLYYSLIVQSHLQEYKLHQNALDGNLDGMEDLLERCRQAVRAAHRKRAINDRSILCVAPESSGT